jgi:lipopolysaccharide export system protein LptC
MTAPSPRELHLPDLPEVAVHLGAASTEAHDNAGPARTGLSWPYRLRQMLSSYLPLGLMALLAIGTAWLIKHTPQAPAPSAEAAVRQAPDYTMSGFSITRFAPDGHVVLRISGDQLRHYPATDRLEIEGVRIQAIAPDGRTTNASAQRALANGDGSEVQLLGAAQVHSQQPSGDELVVQGEFLHAFLRFERLRSHLPVHVVRGGTDVTAGGLDYDHVQGTLQLNGPVRMRLAAANGRAATARKPAAAPLPEPRR